MSIRDIANTQAVLKNTKFILKKYRQRTIPLHDALLQELNKLTRLNANKVLFLSGFLYSATDKRTLLCSFLFRLFHGFLCFLLFCLESC